MTTKQFDDIIFHQLKLMLKNKGININDLKSIEIIKYKYDLALEILVESLEILIESRGDK